MAENLNGAPIPKTIEGSRRSAASAGAVRSSMFKYYIHDGVACCRLQLIGELSELDVPELTGCWNTARTTLGKRQLVLDLLALRKTDEAGREWLLAMVREGATSLPETYFRDHLAAHGEAGDGPRTSASLGKLGRVASLFRGGRDLEVDTSALKR